MRLQPALSLFFFGLSVFAAVSTETSAAQAPAAAQPPKTTWAVTVAEDSRCARAPGFREKLAAQIPDDQRATEAAAELVAEVRVERSEQALIARVTVIDRVLAETAGEREISLPVSDCDATGDALSLVIAVLVEAGRGAPPPAVQAEPEQAPPPPSPPAPKRAPLPAHRYSWLGPRPGHDLIVGWGAIYGLVPRVGWGATFEWGLRIWNNWPVFLGATLYLPSETSDHRAQFRAGYGSVAACPLHVEQSRLRARACPMFGAGRITATGLGFLADDRATRPIVQLGAELAGDFRLWGPLTVGLITRFDVPLLLYRFYYFDQSGTKPTLHESKHVAISSFVTVGLRFR